MKNDNAKTNDKVSSSESALKEEKKAMEAEEVINKKDLNDPEVQKEKKKDAGEMA